MFYYAALVLFIVSPFIYAQVCPLCKKRPQNMLYLSAVYVVFLALAIGKPEVLIRSSNPFTEGFFFPRQVLYALILVLAFEGWLVVRFRSKHIEDKELKSVYLRAGFVLRGTAVICLFFLAFSFLS